MTNREALFQHTVGCEKLYASVWDRVCGPETPETEAQLTSGKQSR